jgi:hypothetical protein
VVHIDRIAGQRRVAQVISVDGYDNRRDQFITSTLEGFTTNNCIWQEGG